MLCIKYILVCSTGTVYFFTLSMLYCKCCKLYIVIFYCLDILSYSMPVGHTTKNGKVHYKDTSYDGVITKGFYKDGTGILTDGKFGPGNAKELKGEGWVGWSTDLTQSQYIDITFEFFGVRKFTNVILTVNVEKKHGYAVFYESRIFFASTKDGFSDTSFLQYTYSPGDFPAQHYDRYNANVTLSLCKNAAKFVKMRLYFGGKWLLITEISFNSGIFVMLITFRFYRLVYLLYTLLYFTPSNAR